MKHLWQIVVKIKWYKIVSAPFSEPSLAMKLSEILRSREAVFFFTVLRSFISHDC